MTDLADINRRAFMARQTAVTEDRTDKRPPGVRFKIPPLDALAHMADCAPCMMRWIEHVETEDRK